MLYALGVMLHALALLHARTDHAQTGTAARTVGFAARAGGHAIACLALSSTMCGFVMPCRSLASPPFPLLSKKIKRIGTLKLAL
eukprot:1139584-Pelagomonas_calceolata.AAC.4